MEITYAQLSAAGPVRQTNEDSIGFWQSDDPDEQRSRGAVVILADGVGGEGHGEVASRLAVEAALKKFMEARPGTAPGQLLTQMFNAANLAVYDSRMDNRDQGQGRMATTLTICLFR